MIDHRFDPDPGRDAETYDVVDAYFQAPDLAGEVVVSADHDQLIDRIAADLVVHAANCVREFGDYHIALSADPMLDRLYERLMYDPNYRQMPWRRTHLWFVHETRADRGAPDSAFLQLNETFGLHADIPPEQFHPLDVGDDAARDYEKQIKEALQWREKGQDRIDYVLLNLAPDGGVGALRPGAAALHESKHFVHAADGGAATLTLPLINAARFIAVQAIGSGVSPVLRRCAEGDATPIEHPVAALAPLSGELKWYLDAEASEGALAADS